IRHYGVSVEKIEEALKAIEYPNLQTVQIIFNCFRQRPAEEFFPNSKDKKVGILARVPLASGLLTGKFTRASSFPKDDHRNYNRHGEAFDVGETFSGVDYEVGLEGVGKILTPEQVPQHQRTGRQGEEDAYFYLRKKGYVIVARNFRSPHHRGEIDLIGWDKDVLCFIEVKTRTTRDVKPAEAAVDREK